MNGNGNGGDDRGPKQPPFRPGQKDFNPGHGGFRPNAGAFVPNTGAFRPGTGYYDPATGSSTPPGQGPDNPGVPGQHRGFGAGRIAPRTEIGTTGIQQTQSPASQAPTPIDVPVPSVPRGGGAVQPIAEKFAANPATGSGGASVSFALPGLSRGLSPSLGLSYDTGAGNGPFGLGWSLGVPQVTRKTDKGIPRYRDRKESDTFVLAGAEDLVPELEDDEGDLKVRESEDGTRRYYRPRTEGAFSRIVRVGGGSDMYWEVTDQDNVTHVFGESVAARIADPDHPHRIFTWLLERSVDAYGNVVLYEYKAEDLQNVPRRASELHRRRGHVEVGGVQKYLKRVLYGNKKGVSSPSSATDFHFEVVFDYGDHAPATVPPIPNDTSTTWPCRADRFSTYRAGFEVRTYRRCGRVLVFHRFATLNSGAATCVHATELTYDEPTGAGEGTVSYLTKVEHFGYDGSNSKQLPAATYEYSTADTLSTDVQDFDAQSLSGIPANVDGRLYQWVDLDGEGVPGVLTQQGGAWRYKRNRGDAELGAAIPLKTQPSSAAIAAGGGQQLADVTGDGLPALVDYEGTHGFYARSRDGDWKPHRLFAQLPTVGPSSPDARMLDLTGDGSADMIQSGDQAYTVWLSLREKGFDAPKRLTRHTSDTKGPNLVFAEASQTVFVADMTGDGLQDLVCLENGSVCYFPNLGYGRFGPKVRMDDAPHMAPSNQFRPDRVRLADVDGSGPADILYLSPQGVKLWRNRGGNGFSPEAEVIGVFPGVNAFATVDVIDLLGTGTACLVWSTVARGRPPHMRYVDLHDSHKPHLMVKSHNGIGMTTTVTYTTSTCLYLEDQRNGIEWATKVPFPVHVVASVEHYDAVAQHRFVSSYRYRHGFYDSMEREFRGFGYVEQRDAETVSEHIGKGTMTALPDVANGELPQPPVLTKTWFHTGSYGSADRDLVAHYETEWWDGASPGGGGTRLSTPALPAVATPAERFQSARALRGQMLRQEVYAEDEAAESDRPYVVSQQTQRVHLVQPAQPDDGVPYAVFMTTPEEALSLHIERAADASDARVSHELTLETDELGRVVRSVAIGYGRQDTDPPTLPTEQVRDWATVSEQAFLDAREETTFYRHSLPSWSKQYELLDDLGSPASGDLFTVSEVKSVVDGASEVSFDSTAIEGLRLLSHQRTRYWKADLSGPEAFGAAPNALALTHQSYVLALLPHMLDSSSGPLEGRVTLDYAEAEGHYVRASNVGTTFAADVDDDSLWAQTGTATFDASNFYQPSAMTEPHGTVTLLTYDSDSHMMVVETELDVPVESPFYGLKSTAEVDYRVLAPKKVTDINGHSVEAAFDELGRVTKTAVVGGGGEGDTLASPTSEVTYAPHDEWSSNGTPHWVKTRARVTHGVATGSTDWMEAYAYANGMGGGFVTKARVADEPTEPMPTPRWVASGRTVLNNKGAPIKQYEPYFSSTSDFLADEAFETIGVSPLFLYDPVGRLIRVDYPDGSYESVAFSPWEQISYDRNDNVSGSVWETSRAPGQTPDPGDADARTKALAHDDTPTITRLDSLGRPFEVEEDLGGSHTLVTRSVMDIEGNVLEVIDPKGQSAMLMTYGPMGQVLQIQSIDAGKRYRFDAATGEALMHWGERGNTSEGELHWEAASRADGSAPLPSWMNYSCATSGTTSQKDATSLTSGHGADVPRAFSQDGTSWGLLLEPAATNIIPTQDFDAWQKLHTPVVTSSQTDPAGGSDAFTVEDDNIANVEYLRSTPGGTIDAGGLALSAWIKKNDANPSTMSLMCAYYDGSAYQNTPNLGYQSSTDWIYATAAKTVVDGTDFRVWVVPANTGTLGSMDLFGVQVEARHYPTSFIDGSRAAADLSVETNVVAPNGYVDVELTVAPLFAHDELSGTAYVLYLDSDHHLAFDGTSGKWKWTIDGTTIESAATTFARHQAITLQAKHLSTDFELAVSGATTGDGTVTGTVQSAFSAGTMHIGGDASGTSEGLSLQSMTWQSPGVVNDEPYVQRVEYDALRRPTGVFLNVGGIEKQVQRLVYGEGHTNAATNNLRGQLIQHDDQSGRVEWLEYDFKGNPLTTARQLATAFTGVLDWSAWTEPELETETFSHEYAYDALNRQTSALTKQDTASKLKLLPTYDQGGKLTKVEVEVRGGSAETVVESIEYDAKGRRKRIDYSDSTSNDEFYTEYTYDELTYRLTHFKTTRSSDDKLVQSLAYFYDPVGNITSTEDSAAGDLVFDTTGTIEEADRGFTYDALYRLIAATGREHQQAGGFLDEAESTIHELRHGADPLGLRAYTRTYAYDDNGNLTSMAHSPIGGTAWDREYALVAGTNRLLQTRNQAGTPGPWSTYSHDAHGNLTAMPHLELIEWDFADRMRHVDKGSGTNQHTYFVYDASGQRVRKVYEHSGLRDEHIYLGGYEIFRQTTISTGVVEEERETIHVSDDVRRVCMVETKTRTAGSAVGSPVSRFRYQLDDHLGSACVEVDENGALITFEEYFPYGTSSFRSADSTSGVSAKRYRYTGKERDESTGLYYHGARYYAPWLGRWTAADPLAFADGVGSYTYVRGDPIGGSDPTGRNEDSPLFDLLFPTVGAWLDDRERLKEPLRQAGSVKSVIKAGEQKAYEASLPNASQGANTGDPSDPANYPDYASYAAGSGIAPETAKKTFAERQPDVTIVDKTPKNPNVVAGRAGGSYLIGVTQEKLEQEKKAVEARAKLSTLQNVAGGPLGSAGYLVGNSLGDEELAAKLSAAGAFIDQVGQSAGVGPATSKPQGGGRRSPKLEPAGKNIARSGPVEQSGPFGKWTDPSALAGATGKRARAGQAAIDAVVKDDFADLNLTFHPQFSPFSGYGVAKRGEGTQIGPKSLTTRNGLRNSIVHEELHHRLWDMGRTGHHPAGSQQEDVFYRTVSRYMRMRGWEQ